MPQVGIEEIFGAESWNTDQITDGILNETSRRNRIELVNFVLDQIRMGYQMAVASALERGDIDGFEKAYVNLDHAREDDGIADFIQTKISLATFQYLKKTHPKVYEIVDSIESDLLPDV
jgi:hypothetical protein